MRLALIPLVALVVASSGACATGPSTIGWNRTRYNEAVRRTDDEQMLLNLVRMRYRDTPQFLELGSISSQYEFGGDIRAGAAWDDDTDFLGGSSSLGIGVKEKPTVTYTPLTGEKFVRRLLTPLDFEQLMLLSNSGWSASRIMRLCIREMNGLSNAATASGPTPKTEPEFAQFRRASALIRSLQDEEVVEILRRSSTAEVSPPLAFSPDDVLSATTAGYGVREGDGGMVLTKQRYNLALRIEPEGRGREDVAELRKLFGSEDDVIDLDIETRSLIAVASYLSQAVETPQEHVEDGLVTVTLRADGTPFDWSEILGDLFRVRSSTSRPSSAAVAIEYRDHWYFIDDADLPSKSTFVLLTQLFALQSGDQVSAAPVLTLSVD